MAALATLAALTVLVALAALAALVVLATLVALAESEDCMVVCPKDHISESRIRIIICSKASVKNGHFSKSLSRECPYVQMPSWPHLYCPKLRKP